MPTENPKISLYVPQTIYDRFKQFQEERELSMSQAGIVILAEYFGLKQIIERTTEGTTIGGVSFDWVKSLEDQIIELKKEVEQLKFTSKLSENQQVEQQNTTSELPKYEKETIENNESKEKRKQTTEIENEQLVLKNQKKEEINKDLPLFEMEKNSNNFKLISTPMLARRLGVNESTIYRNLKNWVTEKFFEWSKKKDFDEIGWIGNSETKEFVPEPNLSNELLSKLQKWIEKNS